MDSPEAALERALNLCNEILYLNPTALIATFSLLIFAISAVSMTQEPGRISLSGTEIFSARILSDVISWTVRCSLTGLVASEDEPKDAITTTDAYAMNLARDLLVIFLLLSMLCLLVKGG